MKLETQDKQWEFLRISAEFERLSHAYIFSGNNDERKQETALRLAQLINCECQNLNERPCGACRACIAVANRRFADVSFVEPDTANGRREIKISRIRGLSASLSLGAWVSPYKIAIISQAETMNQEAQSAFLKLLEEPKGNTLFLLLAEHAEMLFDTIRSRAQEIKFYNFRSPRRMLAGVRDDFEKLRGCTLHERFLYAKKLADAPEMMEHTLRAWLWAARELLLQMAKADSADAAKFARAVRTIQDGSFLIASTNVNRRLALERILLEL